MVTTNHSTAATHLNPMADIINRDRLKASRIFDAQVYDVRGWPIVNWATGLEETLELNDDLIAAVTEMAFLLDEQLPGWRELQPGAANVAKAVAR